MATAMTVDFSASAGAEYAVPNLTEEAAVRTSKVLQENHDKNDIIFTDVGLHNHIVHHICTSFALGATPDIIQKNYDKNDSYQRAPPPLHNELAQDIRDPKVFIANMFRPKTYPDYLKLFTEEIEEKGYQEVIQEYIFKGDERANIMFNRLFAGYLHPIIHLGFGIEFKQPAIIAEALGQTAIHPTFLDPFFIAAEQSITQAPQPPDHLVNILDKIRADKKLSTAAHWEDDHKVRDGIMVRAKDEMIKYVSQWQVKSDKLEEETAEMINACAYISGAAQHPPKQINFDFYYMHAINSSIFFSTFLKQDWISTANKVKLLNWKGRLDLCLYASRRSPALLLDEITNYVPKHSPSNWDAVIARAREFDDDGHACKFVRALAHGERICAPFEENNAKFRIKGKMWLQIANMVMDSVEETGALWIRSAGFEEAWKGFKDRPAVSS